MIGTVFQIVQAIYISFQLGVAKYSAIYGSFAALPLFLLWLQTSWLVILFGAEISFAHQNVDTYEFEPDCLSTSLSFKKLLSLLITHHIVKNLSNNEKPYDADTLSHALEIPIRLVRLILFELVESKVLTEVRNDTDRDVTYLPAVDVGTLTIKNVIESLEQRGSSAVPVGRTKELDKLSECLSTFAEDVEKSPANVLLKEL